MKKILLIFLILNSQFSILNSLSAQTQIALLKYGGGGHAKASGATVQSWDEAMRMLEDPP